MNKSAMRDFLAEHCMLSGEDIQLSGGGASNVYFDCKRATLRGEFLTPLADWILEVADSVNPPPTVIGGPTLGADSIAAAAVMRAAQTNSPLTFAAIVRKEPKKHGTKNTIENEPPAASRVLVVEDVITTGGSIARACDAFIAAGHSIAAIVAIVDREAGGAKTLREKFNVPVFSLFVKSDFEKPQ